MVPDFRVNQKTNRNPNSIPREEIKIRTGFQKGNWGRTEERINLVDIQTEVTNRSNYTYILDRVQYQVSDWRLVWKEFWFPNGSMNQVILPQQMQ